MASPARWRSLVLVAVLFVFRSQPAQAVVWAVPSLEAPTIQAGLNLAASGDTVLVAPGRYRELLFWPFRNGITLLGSGIDSTVVVGDSTQTVLYMPSPTPLDTTTVVASLSFRHGGDAGVAVIGSNAPLFVSCGFDSTLTYYGFLAGPGSFPTLRDCRASYNQIGILLRTDSRAVIVGAAIVHNFVGISAEAPDQACVRSSTLSFNNIGISSSYGDLEVEGCAITQNAQGVRGNGVFQDTLIFERNIISDNYALGGFRLDGSPTITLTDNIILNNTANANVNGGGGISLEGMLDGSRTLIHNNRIEGTRAVMGGGIRIAGGDIGQFTANLVRNNVADFGGGFAMIGLNLAETVIRGNAFTNNTATVSGGGLYFYNAAGICDSNAILENRGGVSGDGVYYEGYGGSPYSVVFEYNNIARNGQGVYNPVLDGIPLFKNNWWGSASGPWHQGVNPSGSGDSLSLYAWDCSPWLTEPVGGVSDPVAVGERTTEASSRLAVRLWPNPVARDRVAQASLRVAESGHLWLGVVDVAGRIVDEVASQVVEPGIQRFAWRTSGSKGTPPGVYWLVAKCGAEVAKTRFVVVR